MKTIKRVFEKIVDYENLYAAYLAARLSKRYRNEVLGFSARLEENLVRIQEELLNGTYRMGRYREFYIYEPKQRLIMAQPFRDRVVQWAIYRILHPLFVKSYISDSHACIDGRGVHSGVQRLHYWLKMVNKKPEKYYYLKLDISKYFYRIDHEILTNILRRKIKDEKLLALLDKIINSETNFGLPPGMAPGEVKKSERISSKGMPVGNLSSQMFANLYLNELDQYCKRTMKIRYYVRYMDDVIILHDDKKMLHAWKNQIDAFLQENLRLDLNDKTCIRPITLGIEFCGYKVWATHIKLRKSTALKMKRQLKQVKEKFAEGKITLTRAMQTVHSYAGILKHCNSHNLKTKIFGDFEAGTEGWFCLQKKEQE